MKNYATVWGRSYTTLALAALSAVLLLASVTPAFAVQGFTVDVIVPPTVNVGEPTRIFVIFTEAGEFIPLDEVMIELIEVATPSGIIELDPVTLVEIDTGWCYIDFAPTEAGHYSIIVVASYGGATSIGAAAFSTTATNKLLSQLSNFREELLVYLEKEFIRTRDILGSAVGETYAKLSAQIGALDEKADAILASIESVINTTTAGFDSLMKTTTAGFESVIKTTTAGFESVMESIDALNNAVTTGFEETANVITATIASSTDAIKGSLRSSTQAIVGTIQNSNNAIVTTTETMEAALDAFAQDISSLVVPFAVGIALAVLFAAIAGIKQLLG